VLRVNLWGVIHGVEAFAPRLIEQNDGGHIISTASFAGLVPNQDLGVYTVSKYGVVALSECLYRDLRPHGIGVSVLCPMRVGTNIDRSYRNRPEALGGTEQRPGTATDSEERNLVGRSIGAEEVAARVLAAVRANELYIHTHAEARGFIRRRFERIDRAFGLLDA
jgi:short-subunit dehydrogenase